MSAVCFNSDQSKMLSSGDGLIQIVIRMHDLFVFGEYFDTKKKVLDY